MLAIKKIKIQNISIAILALICVSITSQSHAQISNVSTPLESTCTDGSGGTCTVTWQSITTVLHGYDILGENSSGQTGVLVTFVPYTDGTESHGGWTIPDGPFWQGSFKILVREITGPDGNGGYIYNGQEGYSSTFTITRIPYIDFDIHPGGVYHPEETLPVDYTTNDGTVTAKLKRISNGALTTISVTNEEGTIPIGQAEGDYKLQLSGSTVTEESNTFRIEPKRVTVTYPYDGLVFEQGAKPVIRWSDNFNASGSNPTFTIEVKDGSTTWVLSSNATGTSYEWEMPTDFHLDNDFRVYVEDNGTSIEDVQSGTFTIEEPNPEAFTLNTAKSTTIKTPISTESQITSLAVDDKFESIGYVDGMGRMRQGLTLKASPNQKDVVTHHAYGSTGEKTTEYLPFIEASGNGNYVPFALDEQQDYYCNTGSCIAQAANVTANSHPYSRTILEKSPLQTVLEQGAPGQDWQPDMNKTLEFDHTSNSSGQDIIRWTVNSSGNPKGNGYYSVNLIAISKTTDENGKESYVYTDREGKEILKEGFVDTNTPVRTYYVYDDIGNLRFIIPPEAVDEISTSSTIELTAVHTIRTTWITEMKYDGYNRVIEKEIPEADPVYTVYDKFGRVALTQDGNMRANNEWFFTKYDIRGRAIMTGTYVESDVTRQSLSGMQDYLDGWTGDTWEDRTSTNYSTQHGYTFQTFPNTLSQSVIWSVTYYDDYDFNNDGTADESFAANTEFTALTGNNRSAHEADITRLNGMVTGSKTRILRPRQVFENDNGEYGVGHATEADSVYYIGTSSTGYSITLKPGFKSYPGQKIVIGSSNIQIPATVMDNYTQGEWLEGVTFYDKYGRTIYTKSTNHLGGEDKSWTLYHFDGEVERTKQTHIVSGATTTIRTRYEYDHNGRITAEYHQTNSETEVRIAEYAYNELGQLVTKGMSNQGNFGANLQTLDYTYHVRGWLESVNNPDNLGADLFAYKLYYDTIPTNGQSLANYNGNIISMDWANVLNGSTERNRYDYSYDGLNQLTQGNLSYRYNGAWETNFSPWNTWYSYDLNGNIKTLKRQGEKDINDYPIELDDLTYSYSGNQIESISDAYGDDPSGFVDGTSNAVEYFYDSNGNMTSDDNKGIANIRYNQMNLPEVITFTSGHEIVFLYDAAGTKLSKTTYPSGGSGVSTDYVGGFVYTDNTLNFFAFSEGRVRKDGSTYNYEFDLKDHLGNVRATFDVNYGGGYVARLLQADSYYPFGLKMPGLSYVASGSDENKFTYNGKELEDEFGLDWYHYGARFYDPTIGRWWVIDPLDEFNSPYSYVGSNPLLYTDPDGMASNPIFSSRDGSYLGTDSRGYEGEAIFMDDDYFFQGMDHELAASVGTFMSDFNWTGSQEFMNSFLWEFEDMKYSQFMGLDPTVYAKKTADNFYFDVQGQGAVQDVTFETVSLFTGLGALGRMVVTKFSTQATTSGTTALVSRYGPHTAQRMAEYKLTDGMLSATLKHGVKYYDPKNNSLMYILREGLASGKSIAVATNPQTFFIKTVMTGTKVVKNRFIPVQ